MECKRASMLMMKYMDSIILEVEAADLDIHLKDCPSCREDFSIYEKMMQDFSEELHLYEPPLNFEICVMEKISLISPAYLKSNTNDNVMSCAFGASSMLIGTGIIASMYSERILSHAFSYPFVVSVVDTAAFASQSAVVFANGLKEGFYLYLDGLNRLMDTWKYGILALVVILIAMQLVLYSKNKIEA